MKTIGLAETIEALRTELIESAVKAAHEGIQFPVERVELEFQVGVTSDSHGEGKLRFWVLELGGGASVASEAVQRVTLSLGPPMDSSGRPVKVARRSVSKP